jgi:hypothetical protein
LRGVLLRSAEKTGQRIGIDFLHKIADAGIR